jgi:predicted alpha/beta-fold hydrolase
MLGIADKAWKAGLNVIRLNQRNCGGSEHLTPTLYHSGLSSDLAAVVTELETVDGLGSVWVAGYSMGGNLTLRMAGQARGTLPSLRGVAAVCPSIDPEACVQSLERGGNWFYDRWFVRRLKERLRLKAALFPGKFDLARLAHVRSLRDFDDCYTAPDAGYADAAEYYEHTGARHVVPHITVPTLIIAAQDDPLVPIRIFQTPQIASNPSLTLWVSESGGHCGFIQRPRPDEDLFWAENRLLEFIRNRQETRER